MTKTIRIAGFGGQGVMLLGQLLAYAATKENLNSLWVPTYGPETRGGTSNCALTISDQPIYSPVFTQSDILIVLNEPSYQKFKDKVKPSGHIYYNESLIKDVNDHHDVKHIGVPINDLALSLNKIQVANMVMLGKLLKEENLFKDETIRAVLEYLLGEKKKSMVDVNMKAIELGKLQ
jgi:2-oxoglutarate ferredoxin oxidoreductase subunit gamma